MDLRHIVKTRRTELGLTLEQVSAKVGVSIATLQRYESGEIDIYNVHLKKIEKLARALEVSPAFLMGWEEPKKDRFSGTIKDDRLFELWRQLPYKKQQKMLSIIEIELEECATSEGYGISSKGSQR